MKKIEYKNIKIPNKNPPFSSALKKTFLDPDTRDQSMTKISEIKSKEPIVLYIKKLPLHSTYIILFFYHFV